MAGACVSVAGQVSYEVINTGKYQSLPCNWHNLELM